MKDTKERIMEAALGLFAAEGYAAASTGAIAGALGITKAALYRHYRDKRDIFHSILRRMEALDTQGARDFDMPLEAGADAPALPPRLGEYAKRQFDYWTGEAFPALFRRLLTLEQYRDGEMTRLYQQYLAGGPVDYLTDLLTGSAGGDRGEARRRALELYGPMFLLYSVYDAAEDRESVRALARRQIDEYMKKYEQS